MRFTLSQAAKEAGISKGTLSKALKAGRMSGERREDGSFQIDASELFRVFPKKPEEPEETRAGTDRKPPETVDVVVETGGERVETAVELAVLRVKLEAAEARIADLSRERETILETSRETVEDLRKRLDKAEERILALAAPERAQERAVEAPAGTTAAKPPRGLLARLLGL